MNNRGLYIHIPFCKSKCLYCNFGSTALSDIKTTKVDLLRHYLTALKKELEYYPYSAVRTVYVGGGTPTVLEADDLADLLDFCRQHFKINPEAEISVEANPGTLNENKLSILKKAGVNRLSLGVQSFNGRLLKEIGRIHTAREVLDNFRLARDIGFDNINIDLIFALPGESFQEWQNDLKKAAELTPEHISVYNLTLEEGTELYNRWQAGQLEKASNDLEAMMYEEAISFLTGEGWHHYEIANFARPGRQSRHNNIYWKNEEYIGIGAGATSYIDGVRYTNTRIPEMYIKKVLARTGSDEDKEFPYPWVEELEKLDGKKKLGEAVMLGLRIREGIKLTHEIQENFSRQIEELIEKRLLEKKDNNLKLTHQGLMLANQVYQEFV
ncbi:MAG: radical SAM family heme chaperone HemW [bacterium]